MALHLTRIWFADVEFPTREVYPFCLPVFTSQATIEIRSPLTFFVGENGSGKTTFLEAIAGKCNIHIWRYSEGARFAPNKYEKALAQFLDVEWREGPVPGGFYSSTSHRDFSLLLDEWAALDPGQLDYFGGRSLMTQSHGQSVMSLFRSNYTRQGLFFADEPETALSPVRQLELARLLTRCVGEGRAQFLIATHSPILLACPGADILSFDGGAIHPVTYEETEHYRVFRAFMADPAGALSDSSPL
jgi:predicted ATPase